MKNQKPIEKLVAEGYDSIGRSYDRFRENFDTSVFLTDFLNSLSNAAEGQILDVGCGTGIPVLAYLVSQGYSAVGIDISDTMLSEAKINVPDATIKKQNMLELDFTDGYFDGLICLHSIIHVPRDQHGSVLRSFNRVLNDEGCLLICTGSEPYEAVHPFLDTSLFFSYPSPQNSLKLVESSNFKILYDTLVNMKGEEFYWILARKNGAL